MGSLRHSVWHKRILENCWGKRCRISSLFEKFRHTFPTVKQLLISEGVDVLDYAILPAIINQGVQCSTPYPPILFATKSLRKLLCHWIISQGRPQNPQIGQGWASDNRGSDVWVFYHKNASPQTSVSENTICGPLMKP